MQHKKIKFYNYKKYLTCQPFFIWHSLEKEEKINEFLDSEERNKFWELISEEKGEKKFFEIYKKSTSIIFKAFEEKLSSEKFLKENKIKGTKVIAFSQSLEKRIAETLKYINSDKIIFYPVFEYKNAIATPFAFDSKNKIIYEVSFSTKTKRTDLIKAFYNIKIVSKTSLINDYILGVLSDSITLKKNQIDIVLTNRSQSQKVGHSPSDPTGKIIFFMDITNYENKTSGKEEKAKKSFGIPNFEKSLESINNAKKENNLSRNLLKQDMTSFGTNPEWDLLVRKLKIKYSDYSGKLVSKKDIINNDISYSTNLKLLEKIKKASIINKEKVISTFIKISGNKTIVWFDFEGFSLPFPIINFAKVNIDIPFQVSVIETHCEKETNKTNLVLDPLNITCDDLFKIVNVIYNKKADGYVVYNKSYEVGALKNIEGILERNNFQFLADAKAKINQIRKKIIDLYEVFRITSKKSVPGIMLHDQKGKASIKNIEKHIRKNKIKLKTKFRDYSNLEVQNGLMAMEHAVKRALGLIGDNVWNDVKNNLIKYCENDVRVMIVVYEFIKKLLNDSKKN